VAVDLDRYAPAAVLRETRDSELKRFRRLHRLAAPVVLFAGPYTEAGGLHTTLAAVERLRETVEGLRIAAIPEGPTDQRYLDECEKRALALGHHAVIEWTATEDERTMWYALAAVVCLPCSASADVPPRAAQLAAAAARPFVGSDIPAVAELVSDGVTGVLIAPGDTEALAREIGVLLRDEDAATHMGERARARAEATWSLNGAPRA
jgi:glycosyltransferase involved in cell wall biosynthesis